MLSYILLFFSGERFKVYKLNCFPCLVFSFITHNMGTSSFIPCLILASCAWAARQVT